MAKSKKKSPFTGLWNIVSMSQESEESLNEEGQAFIDFKSSGWGSFRCGMLSGDIDFMETQRDGKPAVEWSWEGMAEMDDYFGRGWAILEADELRGMIFIHGGDHSDFVAIRSQKRRRARKTR